MTTILIVIGSIHFLFPSHQRHLTIGRLAHVQLGELRPEEGVDSILDQHEHLLGIIHLLVNHLIGGQRQASPSVLARARPTTMFTVPAHGIFALPFALLVWIAVQRIGERCPPGQHQGSLELGPPLLETSILDVVQIQMELLDHPITIVEVVVIEIHLHLVHGNIVIVELLVHQHQASGEGEYIGNGIEDQMMSPVRTG